MSSQPLTYLLKIDGVKGDSTIKGYEGYFTVDEFTFNELTKLTAGTGGSGIGRSLAQFDPLMVAIAGLPQGLVDLFKDAATGKHIPSIELVGLRETEDGFQKLSDLVLGNVTIAGYAADGQHDTAIAFDFTRLRETIAGQNPDGSLNAGSTFSFDLARQGGTINPVNHDALTALAHDHSGETLTYLLKVDGVTGDSTIQGYEGYFTVDEYTFNELTRFAGRGGTGAVTGVARFDPLTVDIAGLPQGLVDLLKDAATGRHIPAIQLVGLKQSGDALQQVSSLTLDNVTIAGYAADGAHDTAIAFDFTALKETIAGQNPDGSLNAGSTFSFDLARQGGTVTPVNHDDLVAFAHAHSSDDLIYLLKVDGVTGDSTLAGYEGYFTVDEFTFNEVTKLIGGFGGSGIGRSLAQFDPLTVDIAGLPQGLVDLLKDAATGKHIPAVQLIGLKQSGDALQQVSSLKLDNVTIAGYAADGQHDTAIAFDFTRFTETIGSQNADGAFSAGSTFSFDLARQGGTVNPVDHDTLTAFAHAHSSDQLTYLLKVDGVTGDSTVEGYEGYFTVDEFTFNELTRFAAGGARGIGIARAQFDPLTVDIAGLPQGLVDLFKDAATGKHILSIDLVGLKETGDSFQKVSDLKLDNVTIAGYAADGQHDTAIAFDFTALKETIAGQNADGAIGEGSTFAYDLARQGGTVNPVDHDTLTAFAHAHSSDELTYLLKIDGVKGDSTIQGYEGYFTVDEFTFNELTRFAGGARGIEIGRAQFDPLTVDLAGLSSGLVDLLKDAATGKHILSIDLVGLKETGDSFQKVSDLKLDNVTIAGFAADGQHDTAVAFDFTRFTETIGSQNADGAFNAGSTFSFDLARQGGSINPVDHTALAAFAHAHDGEQLTYLLKIDGVKGDSAIQGYEGDFAVDEYTFNEFTKLAAGGGGAGIGRALAQFDPLTVDISGLPQGLVDLLKDSATGRHIAHIELFGLKQTGDGYEKVSDLTLNNVTIAGYAADGQHDTAIAFDFTAFKETIADQNPDGSLNAGHSFSFDLARQGGSVLPVDHDHLVAFAHAHGDLFMV